MTHTATRPTDTEDLDRPLRVGRSIHTNECAAHPWCTEHEADERGLTHYGQYPIQLDDDGEAAFVVYRRDDPHGRNKYDVACSDEELAVDVDSLDELASVADKLERAAQQLRALIRDGWPDERWTHPQRG